eukprot:TRINITY_DN9344_c0_g1_i1.p1 TRINITY_DN9344_c0_g1~~TRINITY_DN9344_c0_g1_i1.p1  ORF type:complete len:544 (+),score=196.38 TRINITY_DN9344_c0_g1_i1:97-1632(+)
MEGPEAHGEEPEEDVLLELPGHAVLEDLKHAEQQADSLLAAGGPVRDALAELLQRIATAEGDAEGEAAAPAAEISARLREQRPAAARRKRAAAEAAAAPARLPSSDVLTVVTPQLESLDALLGGDLGAPADLGVPGADAAPRRPSHGRRQSRIVELEAELAAFAARARQRPSASPSRGPSPAGSPLHAPTPAPPDPSDYPSGAASPAPSGGRRTRQDSAAPSEAASPLSLGLEEQLRAARQAGRAAAEERDAALRELDELRQRCAVLSAGHGAAPAAGSTPEVAVLQAELAEERRRAAEVAVQRKQEVQRAKDEVRKDQRAKIQQAALALRDELNASAAKKQAAAEARIREEAQKELDAVRKRLAAAEAAAERLRGELARAPSGGAAEAAALAGDTEAALLQRKLQEVRERHARAVEEAARVHHGELAERDDIIAAQRATLEQRQAELMALKEAQLRREQMLNQTLAEKQELDEELTVLRGRLELAELERAELDAAHELEGLEAAAAAASL